MSTIDTSTVYSSGDAVSQASANSIASALTADDFMQIMLAQLASQDPTDPMDTGQLASQLADLSSMSSMQAMQASVDTLSQSVLASQSLQSTQLIGRQVEVPSSQGELTADRPLSGSVSLDQDVSDLTVTVYDAGGAEIDSIYLGSQSAGEIAFSWDGATEDGSVDPGFYTVAAEGTLGGESTVFDTSMALTVDSVTLDSGGLGTTVTLSNGSEVSLGDIQQVS